MINTYTEENQRILSLKGSLVTLNSKIVASGDVTTRITLEVHGEDVDLLRSLMAKPLEISIKVSE